MERQELLVSTENEGGETRVTCGLPQLTFNEARFVVQAINVRDASGNPLPVSHKYNHPTVSFVVPDHRLAEITLDAVYLDARALKETATDLDQAIDWKVRWQQFKLSDALTDGELKKE